MKVLYVFEGKMRGHGLDLVARHQLEAMSGTGAAVHLISRGRVDFPGVTSRRIVLSPAKIFSAFPAPYYYGATQRWISARGAAMLRSGEFDLAIGWSRSALRLFKAAKLAEVPSIINTGSAAVPALEQAREPGKRWPAISPAEIREEYDLADIVLAPSHAAAARYAECGLRSDKVIPLERGFDPKLFFPPHSAPQKFRVLFCGRVCERKGVRQVLASWDAANLPDAELWFAGAVDGELQEVVRENRRPDVKFLGFTENVPDLMRQCSAQILLSRNESFGKSLVEGAACGLVSIVTPQVGFQIEDGRTGYVVEREDAAMAASRLRTLYESADLRREMSRNAREQVCRDFTWERFRERFLEAAAVAAGRRMQATR